MMRTRRLRARSGMTLMELTVTLIITGLMTVAGAAAFSGIIIHNRVLNYANVNTERAEALRDQIRTWVTAGTIQPQTTTGTPGGANARGGAVTVRANPNAPVGVTAAVATGDEMTFTTSALTYIDAPSTRVRLFVDGDVSTPEYGGLTIEYQVGTSPLQRRELDPNIQAMKVEFLDSRTHQWMEATPGATTVATAPTAARLTFMPLDSTNLNDRLTPLLSVPFIFRIGNPVAATTTPGG